MCKVCVRNTETEPMKPNLKILATSSLVIAALNSVQAQYTPPPPPIPFPGFINDALRKQDPYNSVWDIGGAMRVRYELKYGGIGLPPRAIPARSGRP